MGGGEKFTRGEFMAIENLKLWNDPDMSDMAKLQSQEKELAALMDIESEGKS